MVNELTEAYFQRYPRAFDSAWPSTEHRQSDLQLRALFEQLAASKGATLKDVQKMAKDKLDIALEDTTTWTFSDFFGPKKTAQMSSVVGAGM